MKKTLAAFCFLIGMGATAYAQSSFQQINENGDITQRGLNSGRNHGDSLHSDKKIPIGIKVWNVDKKFGDITPACVDTLSHMFMNSIFTTGMRGEYNSTGNLGAPRIARIFIDRPTDNEQFIFTQPYDFFIKPIEQYQFTNTLSPYTNLTYNNAGDKTNGEDHLTANYAVNAGKKFGAGFKFDYLYGRGYYQNQSTAHFNYSMHASYLGERYQAHLLLSTNHQKVTENGGITNDDYIVHPEAFNEAFRTNEIPVNLEQNWNRNDNQHAFLTHRYSVGFKRKVPMTAEEIEAKKFALASQKEADERKAREAERKKKQQNGDDNDDDEEVKVSKHLTGRPDNARIAGPALAKNDSIFAGDSIVAIDSTMIVSAAERIKVNGKQAADSLLAKEKAINEDTTWMKDEYVPVTSFIHTVQFDNYRRIYQAYQTPADFYANYYDVAEELTGDSLYDRTKMMSLKNTFAISLLEGFNKWAKSGMKIFAAHELRHFKLPGAVSDISYNENNISIGAQLIKSQGKTLHYNALGELYVAGEDAGNLKIDATADLNFRLFGDTVTLAASGFFHRINPSFYYRHYHSRHFWWDNDDMDAIIHSRIEGLFGYRKTRTTLRVAVDEIKNMTYFGQSYTTTADFNRTSTMVASRQESDAINLITASLSQDFTLGPLNWETVLTYQKSSKESVLPVPTFNVYSNLYLRFKIAKVLKCDLGADVRYFTKYYAPDYSPAIGQYTVQEGEQKVEIGNYPLINAYLNFHLKRTRFFIMMSHVNAGSGKANYFFAPHYPLNQNLLRFGLSWNFFN